MASIQEVPAGQHYFLGLQRISRILLGRVATRASTHIKQTSMISKNSAGGLVGGNAAYLSVPLSGQGTQDFFWGWGEVVRTAQWDYWLSALTSNVWNPRPILKTRCLSLPRCLPIRPHNLERPCSRYQAKSASPALKLKGTKSSSGMRLKSPSGDILRSHYQQLSADPNSSANLDQDLPNNLQGHIPIFSLYEDWLWCETWCSKDRLDHAKSIDLCQNPLTIAHFTRMLAVEGRIHASAAAADVNELAKTGSVALPVPEEEATQGDETGGDESRVFAGHIRDEL
ncbi:hypothetical protein V8E53_015325 [Lactarius tabidus]